MTGEELRALRDRLGLTQMDLALKIGVTPASIHRWETGKARMHGTFARALRRLEPSHREAKSA